MKFFGYEICLEKSCPDCERLRREVENLQTQNEVLAQNQMELLDALHALKEKYSGKKEMA